jgi:16S rRNA (guanine1207-N2)-methyltransferase
MSISRLSLALDGASLPDAGRIAVFRARAGDDLSALPKDRVEVIQGFRPDHDALVARGFDCVPVAGGPYVAAVVVLPRARAEARALVAEAATQVVPGGPIWVDGQKTDGIDTMLRDLRGRVPVSDPMAKAHGKIFRFDADGGAAFADWVARPGIPVAGFETLPGVFSADGVDPGSAALVAALPAVLPARVADLGAGWGWLAAQALRRAGVEELHLIEAEHAALDCARRNIADPRARFHWADAATFRPEAKFQAVLSNPPFHQGRAADPGLGAAFIRAAAAMLTPSGVFWMVANRHLPYEKVLGEHFREVAEVAGDTRFKVFRAASPMSNRSGGRPK